MVAKRAIGGSKEGSDAPLASSAVSKVSELLGTQGPFATESQDWEPRKSQMEMADAVAHALHASQHLVVEAPTGVGKTLGYLLPAVLLGARVIVSTHTKNLQDQLIDKDIPRLAAALKHLGVALVETDRSASLVREPAELDRCEVRYTVMKGRNNYLCLDRIERRTRQGRLDFSATETDMMNLNEVAEWGRTSRRGDRSELTWLKERSEMWDNIDARSDICSGSRCSKYAECFVTRMREEGERADIIIVNHHLLFADLALRARADLTSEAGRFGQVIPNADYLVIDEAHTLESIASDHFGGVVSFTKIDRLFNDVVAMCGERQLGMDTSTLVQAVARAALACTAVFAELPEREGRLPLDQERASMAALRAAGTRAREALADLRKLLEDAVHYESSAEAMRRRTQEIEDALMFVLKSDDADYVYWADGTGPAGKVGASPVNVGHLLETFLFKRFRSVVLTSATLSAGEQDFRYFRRAIGVPETAEILTLETAFNYEVQAALVLPKEATEPDAPNAEAVRVALAERAIRALGGGALVLCTSNRAMKGMHKALAPRLPYPCLLQGEQPKRQLIAEFRAQAPAVLFATQSFWEGVDIPGDALRLVLVDRLPFDVPSDPMVKARAKRLTAEGCSPFTYDLLPRAILRLQQGFGRLIRTRADRGAVVILDARMTSRAYGSQFVRSLPAARQLNSIDELAHWWKSVSSQR
ncbi:MAG: ATP-dependent DNA helicase [Myxococcales bacterium]|nr:ATP-dependent DNA helicase [Myxococcales bacterium]